MARITICDLCKQQVKKNEAGPWGLSLFYQVKNPNATSSVNKRKLDMEVCDPCTTAIIERHDSDKPPTAFQKAPESPAPRHTRGRPSVPQRTSEQFSDPVGPTEAERAERKPTDKLLDDEIHIVPTTVNHLKGSRELLLTQRKLDAKKGCPHHFKTWEEGVTRCGNAPPAYTGEFANFVGCEKVLSGKEL